MLENNNLSYTLQNHSSVTILRHSSMTILINLNHNILTCSKAEIKDLTVCIVVNGEKLQSHGVTLTLIGQWSMSNLSELFSYNGICSSFKWIEPLFFVLSCTQTHIHTCRQTDRQTHRQT